MSTPADLLIMNMKLGEEEKEVKFLVDTGPTYSALNKALVPIENYYVIVVGATGQSKKAYFNKLLKYKFWKQWGIHRFLYLPNSPKPLLRSNWLKLLQVNIEFRNEEIVLEVNNEEYLEVLSLILTAVGAKGEINKEILSQVFPGVWAPDVPRITKTATPIQVRLKEKRQPVRIKQYPLRKKDRERISPVI